LFSETTKFHLSKIFGFLSILKIFDFHDICDKWFGMLNNMSLGILCAQKPLLIRGILSIKNHQHVAELTHSCHPSVIGGF